MRPSVYIVQEPMTRDEFTGEIRPRFNTAPASQYGDLKIVLPRPYRFAKDPYGPLVAHIRDALVTFSECDSLLCIGEPTAISVASAIAANRNGGRYKLLLWNNLTHEYEQIQITAN